MLCSMVAKDRRIQGPRLQMSIDDGLYPDALRKLGNPPRMLYVLGDPSALQEGLAVVGARRATPYGLGCARRFAFMAAERGIVIVSGGARGCDAVAHEAALAAGGRTVVFLGGGVDEPYPAENAGLFQRVVDAGGALVSEHEWGFHPMPFAFRERNRLIAGLARATLIVEAGLPSGTFSTADAALEAGREVLVVPGSITSETSRGANRLLYQGATPVVDDESFDDVLFSLFGCLKQEELVLGGAGAGSRGSLCAKEDLRDPGAAALLAALNAEPLGMEALRDVASLHVRGEDPLTWLMVWLAKLQSAGLVAQYPDGRYGPRVTGR